MSERNARLPVALLALLALAGCGSDPLSGDEVINRTPPLGPLECTVLAGGNTAIHAASVPAPAGQCGVEVVTGNSSISDANGIAFHLTYPTFLSFVMYEDTGALAPDSAPTELFVTNVGNEVVVGYTRVGAVGGVSLAPGTALFRVFFQAANIGVGVLGFSDNELRDSGGLIIDPPPSWQAATVAVILAP
jgi:hypothetical protein